MRCQQNVDTELCTFTRFHQIAVLVLCHGCK